METGRQAIYTSLIKREPHVELLLWEAKADATERWCSVLIVSPNGSKKNIGNSQILNLEEFNAGQNWALSPRYKVKKDKYKNIVFFEGEKPMSVPYNFG